MSDVQAEWWVIITPYKIEKGMLSFKELLAGVRGRKIDLSG